MGLSLFSLQTCHFFPFIDTQEVNSRCDSHFRASVAESSPQTFARITPETCCRTQGSATRWEHSPPLDPGRPGQTTWPPTTPRFLPCKIQFLVLLSTAPREMPVQKLEPFLVSWEKSFYKYKTLLWYDPIIHQPTNFSCTSVTYKFVHNRAPGYRLVGFKFTISK